MRARSISVYLITVHIMSSTVPDTWQALNAWINGVIISDIDVRKMRPEESTQLVLSSRVRI